MKNHLSAFSGIFSSSSINFPTSFRHLSLIFSASFLQWFCSREYRVQRYSAIFSRFPAVFQRSFICNSSIFKNIQLTFNQISTPGICFRIFQEKKFKTIWYRLVRFGTISYDFVPFGTIWYKSVKSYLSIARNCNQAAKN
jgi:hypothetical protein